MEDKLIIDCDFKLKISFKNYKAGDVFESFSGLVHGIDGIDFLDKEYFEPINIQYAN